MGVIQRVSRDDVKMQDMGNGYSRGIMLEGLMEGVSTYRCVLKAGCRVDPEKFSDKIQLIYFVGGSGYVASAKRAYNILDKHALFVPRMDEEEFFIKADTDLEFLLLISDMNDWDKKRFADVHIKLPHFTTLDNCIQYVEGFRDESVRSLSVLNQRYMCRYSMGAVLGKGPIDVAPHSHSQLYQWFYGMPGAEFQFACGDEEITVRDGDWVGIPNNIEHVVKCDAGKNVDYIWYEVMVPGMEE